MKKKEIKLEQATLAYNRFSKEENVLVQLLQLGKYTKDEALAEIFIPKAALTKSWEELMTIIRFRFRKDHGYILPKNCSYFTGNV